MLKVKPEEKEPIVEVPPEQEKVTVKIYCEDFAGNVLEHEWSFHRFVEKKGSND